MGCARSIKFVIPGKTGIQVTATEVAGSIVFSVEAVNGVARTADINGLFFHFNETKLSGLTVIGDGNVTGSQLGLNNVINLGDGTNMNGAASPFDIGVKFGAPASPTPGPITFTLASAGGLTLDDFAHMDFGAKLTSVKGKPSLKPGQSKVTFTAPAAPDAVDDTGLTKEDLGVTLDLLSNDTDADGDQLTITDIDDGPAHGTVTIAADGKSVIYTPFEDYAGQDMFSYCVSDGAGGQDSAQVTVNITPVADPPDVTIAVLAAQPGDPVNLVRLRVTANQTDFDHSEFIDGFTLSGIPQGILVNGVAIGLDGKFDLDVAGQPDSATQDFTLLLAGSQDTNFSLAVTAESEEEGVGDPDSATTTVNKTIALEYNTNTATKTFLADDRSIWSNGAEFTFDSEIFTGVNTSRTFGISEFGVDVAGATVSVKAGLVTGVHLEGGQIDASVPFDISVSTIYNKTTDLLKLVSSSSLANGGSFTTTGPEAAVDIDTLVELGLRLFAPGISETFNANFRNDLFSYSSSDGPLVIAPVPGVKLTLDWPTLNTSGSQTVIGTLTSTGTSNNAVKFEIDVDQLASLGIAPPDGDGFELLDIDVNGALKFLQSFVLQALGVTGTLNFEDGSSQAFNLNGDLTIANASAKDADMDGLVEFSLGLELDASLTNSTDLAYNSELHLAILKNIPILGTLVDTTLPIVSGTVDVYDNTFQLAFNSQNFDFVA